MPFCIALRFFCCKYATSRHGAAGNDHSVADLQARKKAPVGAFFHRSLTALFCREVALHERVKLAIEHEHIGIFAVTVAFLGDVCVIHRKPGAFKCFFYRCAVGALQ